jgi:hypothetical protein
MRTTNSCLRLNSLYVIAILFINVLFSCKKDVSDVSFVPEKESASLIKYFTSKGYSAKDIQVKDRNFILSKDMVISFDEVKLRMEKEAASGEPQPEHWRWNYLVSNTYRHNITIFIDGGVPFDWQLAVQAGVSNWNSLGRTTMSFTFNPSAANIIVSMNYEDATWVGRALLPTSNGKPGSTIEINSKYNNEPYDRKIFAMTHELGHTIGFMHTNQQSGIFITGGGPWSPNTPENDPNSVMNSFVLSWTGFTDGDILATNILYPL